MKIAIDIGHANNTGSRGNGLEEHAVAVEIAAWLNTYLKDLGHQADVIDFPNMSNRDDLNATIKAANSKYYDCGVSIHCDCSDNPDAHGAHACYYSSSGKRLAGCIAVHLCDLMPGRVETVVRRTDLAVLKQTKPTWVLCECGFISNKGNADIMKSYPNSIAQQIAFGISDYAR